MGCELVISGSDTPTLLDPVEEPLDEVARAVQVRTKADRVLAIAFRRNVGPRTLLVDECPDPISVIAAICKQHRLR